jgi:hypothetical protein
MGDFTLYSAEGRQVTVPDPSGGIADAAGKFDGLLWRHRIELPILGQADPYEEVDFTSEQATVMEGEIAYLLERASESRHGRGSPRSRPARSIAASRDDAVVCCTRGEPNRLVGRLSSPTAEPSRLR